MTPFDLLLKAVTERAARTLKLPIAVIAIRRAKGGEFETRYCIHGLTRGEVEATALDLLRAIRDEIDPDDTCPNCAPRRVRAEAAIAVLEAERRPAGPDLH